MELAMKKTGWLVLEAETVGIIGTRVYVKPFLVENNDLAFGAGLEQGRDYYVDDEIIA